MKLPLLRPLLTLAAAACLAGAMAGCAGVLGDPESQGAPLNQLSNTRGRPLPPNIRRVLALPLYNPQIVGDTQKDLDQIFETELNKHQRFEVVRMSREALSALIRQEEISSCYPTARGRGCRPAWR